MSSGDPKAPSPIPYIRPSADGEHVSVSFTLTNDPTTANEMAHCVHIRAPLDARCRI